MPAPRPSHLLAAALLAAILTVGRPAAADQTDPRLGGLFAQLKAAPDPAAAGAIEAEIWAIWTQSGRAEVDGLMAEGADALAASDGAAALAAFDRVVRLAPHFAEGWNKRATTLYLLGRTADSIADIDRVLALEPRHFGALSGLGLCEARRDRLPQALAAFERALAIDPNLPGVRANIAALKAEIARRSI